MNRKLKIPLLLWGKKRAETANYLLRDEFSTDEAAPMATPRTCEPGPGTLTVTELPAISGGAIVLLGASVSNRVQSPVATTKAAGRALFGTWISGQDYGYVGYASSNFSAYRAASKILYSPTGGATLFGGFANLVNNTVVFLVWRTGGGMIYLRNNRIFWVDNSTLAGDLYPSIFTTSNNNISVSRFGEVDLGAPWNSDATIYTAISATPGAGSGITAESNAFIETTWQAITNEVFELSVRQTNADNRWIVRCDQAGSTVKLIERAAGTETERGTAAQTWTNGTSYRIIAIADGTSIQVFIGTVSKFTYASAVLNESATGVVVSHACTNLIAWPRYVTGDLLARLVLVDPTVNP